MVGLYLARINEFNPILNAFITITTEEAYNDARIAEEQINQGKYLGLLHGIPFSVKDNFYTKGIKCTAGSKVLSDYISNIEATCVKRMKKAGAILIGKNNLNEFAYGLTGINQYFGPSRNPWNTDMISGGSSGGSAVAVASDMVPISLCT